MNKRGMQFSYLRSLFIIGGIVLPKLGLAALSCTVATTCTTPDVAVFNLSNTTNAHAELATQNNYSQLVCCSGVTGLSNSCVAGNSKTLVNLSSDTNAHMEINTQTNYASLACISSSQGTFFVGYQTTDCSGWDTTVASMSSPLTNAHGGDSTAYVNKICASHNDYIAPVIDTINTAITSGGTDKSAINLIDGTTTSIYVHGSASDGNGCTDINTASNWSVTVYRTNVSGGSACTGDNNNCYHVNTSGVNFTLSNCAGGGDQTLNYEAVIPLQFYAEPTDTGSPNEATNWSVYVHATDLNALTDSRTDQFELNTLAALTVTPTIDFSALTLGENSGSTNQTLVATNSGNARLDIGLSSYGNSVDDGLNMVCTRGSIGNGYLKYDLTAFAYAAGIIVPSSDTEVNFNLLKSTGSVATKNIYFGMAIPQYSIEGNCSGTVVINAINDTIQD